MENYYAEIYWFLALITYGMNVEANPKGTPIQQLASLVFVGLIWPITLPIAIGIRLAK